MLYWVACGLRAVLGWGSWDMSLKLRAGPRFSAWDEVPTGVVSKEFSQSVAQNKLYLQKIMTIGGRNAEPAQSSSKYSCVQCLG